MSKHLQELCALVVEEKCGRLASQIFSILAQKGRHTIFELRREFPHITHRQMRQAIVTLLQQHIILYYQVDEGPTFYHADWRNPARSIRAALIAALVAERYGDSAAKIVTNLQQLGHARVRDLAQAFDLTPTSKRDSGYESCNGHTNGAAKANGVSAAHDTHRVKGDKIVTVGQFHATLRSLLKAGVLVKRGKHNYIPAADLQAQMEAVVINEQFPDGKINGAKKQSEFQAAVKTLKRKRQEANEYSATRDNESRGQIQRPSMSDPAAKRAKLNGGLSNGVHHDADLDADESVSKLPSDLIVAVNFAQYPIAHRSQRLEQFAAANLGGITATVYAALMHVLESKIRARDDNFHEEQDSEDQEARLPSATTTEIADVLKTWIPVDLTTGIYGAAAMYKKPEAERDKSKKGKKRTAPDEDWGDIGIKMEVESEDEDDETQAANGFASYRDQNKMLSLIDEHLKLLTEHPKTFCRRVGAGGRGEWKVDFGVLTDSLIALEIDETVKSRLSKVHAMIVRMLRDVGRLEDKEIAARLMMRVKDVRSILTQLQFAGLVEGQEVPKDNSRQPSRAVYLWYHDQSRVAALLLQQAYQGMSRILQRLAGQRESSRGIIEKAEMMNTKEESLNQIERDHLMQWREIEERLMAQFLRLDEHVALLRDFSGKDTSLTS